MMTLSSTYDLVAVRLCSRGWTRDTLAVENESGELREFSHPRVVTAASSMKPVTIWEAFQLQCGWEQDWREAERRAMALARSLIRDTAYDWPERELAAPPRKVCTMLTEALGEEYDFDRGEITKESGSESGGK